jgi:hypothetical protein
MVNKEVRALFFLHLVNVLVAHNVTKKHISNLPQFWDNGVWSFRMLLYDNLNQLSPLKTYLLW